MKSWLVILLVSLGCSSPTQCDLGQVDIPSWWFGETLLADPWEGVTQDFLTSEYCDLRFQEEISTNTYYRVYRCMVCLGE